MKTLTLLIVAASLSACVSLTPAERATVVDLKITASICDTLPTISYDSKLDTAITKAQIKLFNAKRNAFCANPTKTKETK